MNTRRSFVLTLPGALALAAQEREEERPAPYVPTPMPVVRKMLEVGGLKPKEKMFDLGSGDGRIVLVAAKEFGAEAVGVEYNAQLVEQSRRSLRKAGLEKRARIIEGDLFEQDYSSADLITVYLLPGYARRLRPLLERQLRKGARVVAHDFLILGWVPVETVDIEDDGTGRSRTLFLYRL